MTFVNGLPHRNTEADPSVEEQAILYFGGPRPRNKRVFTKMALTWATGVRFGRATRRNERENELQLAANSLRRFGSSSGPRNAYFHELFYVHFRISVSIYMLLKLMKMAYLNFDTINFFTSNSVPFGWNLGGWGRTHGYSLNQRV
ncbi:hypothetical protein Hanom_Chr07g00606071 [Helianthus anomalus]